MNRTLLILILFLFSSFVLTLQQIDVEPYEAVDRQYLIKDSISTFLKVRTGLGWIESGNDYKCINRQTKALGKYQFMPRYFWKHNPDNSTLSILNFAKSLNIKILSYADFLNNPTLQEEYFKHYYNNCLRLRVSHLSRIYGDGALCADEMIALYHFEPSTLIRYLQRGVHRERVDTEWEQNPSSRVYLARFNKYKHHSKP